MKILISPTKTMRNNTSKPRYIPENIGYAEKLAKDIKKLTVDELKSKMKISEKIANEVFDMYQNIKFDEKGLRAVESFDGLQYKRLDYSSLSKDEQRYIDENVLIYSGLYGLIKPDDSIYPHRLDFNMKFSLYKFWGDILYKQLPKDEIILDVSSGEFMKIMEPYAGDNYYKVFFKEKVGDKIISKATESKIMRGLFVRWLSKNKVDKIESLRKFNEFGYRLNEIENGRELVYIK